MAIKKPKFYVVWEGRETGIFTDWSIAQPLVSGHPGAKFKSFDSHTVAGSSFRCRPGKPAKALQHNPHPTLKPLAE